MTYIINEHGMRVYQRKLGGEEYYFDCKHDPREWKITYGKYKGVSYNDVLKKDPKYFVWLISTSKNERIKNEYKDVDIWVHTIKYAKIFFEDVLKQLKMYNLRFEDEDEDEEQKLVPSYLKKIAKRLKEKVRPIKK